MVSCSDRGDDVAQSVPSTHEREQRRQKEKKYHTIRGTTVHEDNI